MRGRRQGALAATLVVAAAVGWGIWGPWRGGGVVPPAARGDAHGAPRPVDAAPGPATSARPPADSAAAALPRSLRGSAIDGAYTLDADGRLLPSPSVLRRFDWFLAASGEEPEAVIRARIEADIARELSPPAAADARDLLARYLAYREEARALDAAGLGAADLDTRLQRIRELRRAHFGAGAASLLFGEEEQLAFDALERVRIARDATLDDAERARRLAALDAALPEPMARVRSQATVAARLAREEALLRAQGGSASDLRRLREQTVGAEAASRLEALDARRRDWQQRLAAYREARQALLGDGPPAADALDALRAEHFAPEELARVRALDRVADARDPALSSPAASPAETGSPRR